MPTDARRLLAFAAPRLRPGHRPTSDRVRRHAGRQAPVATGAPPSRTLALVALVALRPVGRPHLRPETWTRPAFGRAVELVRRHLAPVHSRAVLAASFGREALHADPGGEGEVYGPVTVAYAIRWLELGDGEVRPGWAAWLAESAPRPAAHALPSTPSAIAD